MCDDEKELRPLIFALWQLRTWAKERPNYRSVKMYYPNETMCPSWMLYADTPDGTCYGSGDTLQEAADELCNELSLPAFSDGQSPDSKSSADGSTPSGRATGQSMWAIVDSQGVVQTTGADESLAWWFFMRSDRNQEAIDEGYHLAQVVVYINEILL